MVEPAPKINMSDHPTILITGGTRRLGKAIARHYAHRGWRLVLCYAGDREAAEATRASLVGVAKGVRTIARSSAMECGAILDVCP